MSLPNTYGRVDGRNLNCWRNRVAVRLANAALRVATDEYRGFIKGSIGFGLVAVAAQFESAPAPESKDAADE